MTIVSRTTCGAKATRLLAMICTLQVAIVAAEPLAGQDSVEFVLAHYAQASGGDALAEIRTETRRGTLVRGSGGPVPCEIVSSSARRWRWGQSLAWGDQFAYGFDGTNGWVHDARGVGPMSPRQALDFQLLFDITSPLRMHEMYPEITVKGAEQVGDKEATVLLARSIEGLTTELAFDRETGLLLRAGEVFLEDYRDVGGVTRPFRLRLGNMLRVQLTEIRHDLDVEETLRRGDQDAFDAGLRTRLPHQRLRRCQ